MYFVNTVLYKSIAANLQIYCFSCNDILLSSKEICHEHCRERYFTWGLLSFCVICSHFYSTKSRLSAVILCKSRVLSSSRKTSLTFWNIDRTSWMLILLTWSILHLILLTSFCPRSWTSCAVMSHATWNFKACVRKCKVITMYLIIGN